MYQESKHALQLKLPSHHFIPFVQQSSAINYCAQGAIKRSGFSGHLIWAIYLAPLRWLAIIVIAECSPLTRSRLNDWITVHYSIQAALWLQLDSDSNVGVQRNDRVNTITAQVLNRKVKSHRQVHGVRRERSQVPFMLMWLWKDLRHMWHFFR